MPWRLVQFIVLFVIFLAFIGFNLGNKCDIRFFFTDNAKIKDVPVFFTVFFSFIIGMLCTLPFIFGSRLQKKEKPVQGKGLLAKISAKQAKKPDEKPGDSNLADKNHYGID